MALKPIVSIQSASSGLHELLGCLTVSVVCVCVCVLRGGSPGRCKLSPQGALAWVHRYQTVEITLDFTCSEDTRNPLTI